MPKFDLDSYNRSIKLPDYDHRMFRGDIEALSGRNLHVDDQPAPRMKRDFGSVPPSQAVRATSSR